MLNLLKSRMFQQPPSKEGGALAAEYRCLGCAQQLHHHIYGFVCSGCGSRWWHLGRLERDGWIAPVMALRDAAAPINDPVKGRQCIQCRTRMSVVHGPGVADGGNLEWAHERLDVCLPCDNLWLDPEELPGLEHGVDPASVQISVAAIEEEKPQRRRFWRR